MGQSNHLGPEPTTGTNARHTKSAQLIFDKQMN